MIQEIITVDITDVETLTSAFKKADSAFTLLPDNVKAENTRAYQRMVTGALIKAIEDSGIKYIVNMSSLGSHMHEGNGIIASTGEQEVRLISWTASMCYISVLPILWKTS